MKIVKFATEITAEMRAEEVSAVVAETTAVMARVVSGDLRARMSPVEDRFGVLRTSINDSMAALQVFVDEVHMTSSTIAQGVREVSEGNLNLSTPRQRLSS